MNRMNAVFLASAFALAQPASAQDFYFGGGLAYSSGTSDGVTGGSGESDLSAGMVTLILGQRYAAGNGFWGWETSADLSFGSETENSISGLPCSSGASGSYLCSHDATIRVVGMYGASVGQGTEIYGSLGLGLMTGDYATNAFTVESASTYGVTVGVGLTREFANGLIGRGEVIYDDFGNDTQDVFDSSYSGATVRLALLRRF
jgi:Outer membrane protein beta-barrel domain